MNKFNKMLDDNMFFRKSFLKKAAFWMYALFFMAMLLIFKWHWLTAYFMIIYISLTIGPVLFFYCQREIYKKHDWKQYITFYPIERFMTLCFTPSTLGVFLIAYLCCFNKINAFVLAIIFVLPMLGIGLRPNCFNDKSRNNNSLGYRPFIYLGLSMLLCYIGFPQVIFEHNVINQTILCAITCLGFLALIFPDKGSNLLRFNNKTEKGFLLYIILIFIVFFIVFHFTNSGFYLKIYLNTWWINMNKNFKNYITIGVPFVIFVVHSFLNTYLWIIFSIIGLIITYAYYKQSKENKYLKYAMRLYVLNFVFIILRLLIRYLMT